MLIIHLGYFRQNYLFGINLTETNKLKTMTDQQEKKLYFLLSRYKSGQINAAQVVAEVKGMIKSTPKKGDILIAISECEMEVEDDSGNFTKSGINALTLGKEYVVNGIESDCFFIIDDGNEKHLFEFSDWHNFFIPSPPKQ